MKEKWTFYPGVDLSRADLRGINLYGAKLRGAKLFRAGLAYAKLVGADLRDADLYGAELFVTDLTGADLTGADLTGADFTKTSLRDAQGVIDAGHPNGWRCVGWMRAGVIQVSVGCRDKTLTAGRAYWAGKEDRREVLAALDYIEVVARLRGWPIAEQQAAA